MIVAWLRRHVLFVVVVILPTACATLYFGLLASDVYVSESEFVVNSSQGSLPTGGIESLLTGAGLSRGHADAAEVREYILSRDALKELNARLKVDGIFGRPDISFIDRYPGLVYDHSFEELFRYYGRHVDVEADTTSSISTLSVRAYSAEDARRINAELLDMAERLVNTLNERSRRDLVQFASNEVKLASDKARDAALALLSFRSNQTVFEPSRQAALQLEIVSKVRQQLITTEAEIAEIRKLSPDNPQLGGLESNAEMLRKAIAAETGKVTSKGNSLSANTPAFERLELDVEFADKQLGYALAGLESARSEAQKQQIYLERITQPSVQDKAMEPRRLRSILATFVISLIAFGVASILVASVREHAD